MIKNQNKINQKTKIDAVHPIYRVHKHHLALKLIELALFLVLFIISASAASASSVSTDNIETLINQERTSRGLDPLTDNSQLDQAALSKSADMISRKYFEHYAYGLSPWDFIKNQNYDYLYAGENLAMDFQTSEAMVSAWMNSPMHRKNILNPDYTEMGVGVVKGQFTDAGGTRETYMVTNMFASPRPAIIRVFDNIVSKVKSIFQ